MAWTQLPDAVPARPGPAGRGGPILAVAVAVVLVVLGRLGAALALVVLTVLITQAVAVSSSFARRFHRGLSAVGHIVGHAVSLVLLGAVFAFLFIPVAAFSALVRRPLRRSSSDVAGAWSVTRPLDANSRRRTFAGDSGPVPGGWAAALLKTAGALTVLAVLDLAAGSLLAGTGVLQGEQGDVLAQQTALWDQTMSSPAIVDEPWAEAYGDSMVDLGIDADPDYVPYLIWSVEDFESPYVNSAGGERVSYRPPRPPGVEPLQVAFFGGSALFGLGQRDEHTIPSEFARLAAEAGVAVEVHNYGVSGWVSWQEFHYLERLYARGERYDLIVFYDGANDFIVQQSSYSTDPTHNGVNSFNELGELYHEEHNTSPGIVDGFQGFAEAYWRSSAISVIGSELFGEDPEGDAFNPGGSEATPQEQADAALGIYRRAMGLVQDLAARNGDTPVRFFWQAQAQGWPAQVLRDLPEDVTDLSGVFDEVEEPLYIDAVHTNELGGRLVAEALWSELSHDLRREADQVG